MEKTRECMHIYLVDAGIFIGPSCEAIVNGYDRYFKSGWPIIYVRIDDDNTLYITAKIEGIESEYSYSGSYLISWRTDKDIEAYDEKL